GIRVPAHPVALALIREAGVPIAAPSANRSTEISPTRAEHVLKSLGGRIGMILDGGPTTGGIESTVVDLAGDAPRILRPALISAEELSEALGEAVSDATVSVAYVGDSQPARSPGQMRRHYAPKARVELVEDDGYARAASLAKQGARVGW